MAKEKAPVASAAPAEDRKRAIEAAMGQIEKNVRQGLHYASWRPE